MRLRTVVGPVALVLAVTAGMLLAADKNKDKRSGTRVDLHAQPAGAAPMDDSKRALHALNRLTFGPRPGDVQRVQSMGVDKWIELQLHPEKIDNSSLDARLAPFRTLKMDSREMVENFPPNQVLKAV